MKIRKGRISLVEIIRFYHERFELLDTHNNGNGHPVPWRDGIANFQDEDICGFASIEQLKRWFSKHERNKLREFGWKFLVMKVNKRQVKVGGHQCIFNRHHAKIIKELTEDEISHWKQNRTDKARVEKRSA